MFITAPPCRSAQGLVHRSCHYSVRHGFKAAAHLVVPSPALEGRSPGQENVVKTECCSVAFIVNIVPLSLQPLPMWDGLVPFPSKAISVRRGGDGEVSLCCVPSAWGSDRFGNVPVVPPANACVLEELGGEMLRYRHSDYVVAVQIVRSARLQSAVHKRVL